MACQVQLSKGVCTTNGCSGNHSFIVCEFCAVICPSTFHYNNHCRGKLHIRHTKGVYHDPRLPLRHCITCNRDIPVGVWTSHIRGKAHLRHQSFSSIKQTLEQSESNKNGVVVECLPQEFGVVDSRELDVTKTMHFTVKNSVASSNICLSQCRLSSGISRKIKSSFSVDPINPDTRITSSKPLRLVVRLLPQWSGVYKDRLELHFEDKKRFTTFAITKSLSATVTNRSDFEAMKPTAPYVKPKYRPRDIERNVLPGEKPPSFGSIRWVVPLPLAPMPTEYARLFTLNAEQAIATLKTSQFSKPLDCSTHTAQFKLLVYAEENRSEQDLQRYDMEGATLSQIKNTSVYTLDVPGLAEKRPSVILGDKIVLKPDGVDSWFEGYVHDVGQHAVGLKFHKSFNPIRGQKFLARFKLNRSPVRRIHQALDVSSNNSMARRFLFPEMAEVTRVGLRVPTRLEVAYLSLVNRNIGSNEQQAIAVAAISRLPAGSPPFITFGPPGTGKTVTLVESVHQVLKSNPLAKVLVCAPSNSAADVVAARLATALNTTLLFRLNAPTRMYSQLPALLQGFSRKEGTMFTVPPLSELQQFRVIVSTCISACAPNNIGFPKGHFTHIFIDEAGQATEPELLISVKLNADSRTNLILCGDPKQLGPIVRSPIARQLGLAKSYLDRLMERDIYQLEGRSGQTIVKLVKNFRSHGAILNFPNGWFYGGELQQCGDPVVVNSFAKSDILKKPGFPIVFHAIKGQDEREAKSPSFFNRHEATEVKAYIKYLLEERSPLISANDIGVISPYHAQCQKIRALLQDVGGRVKVGSVEEFQGQERRVIIISTVRSTPDLISFDLKHSLGFVAHPRRFNVAITRAQALLILIGDPDILGQDPLWRSFLNFVHNGGGWKGPEMGWDPKAPVEGGGYDQTIRMHAEEDMKALLYRLRGLGLNDETDDVEGNFDKPWREAN